MLSSTKTAVRISLTLLLAGAVQAQNPQILDYVPTDITRTHVGGNVYNVYVEVSIYVDDSFSKADFPVDVRLVVDGADQGIQGTHFDTTGWGSGYSCLAVSNCPGEACPPPPPGSTQGTCVVSPYSASCACYYLPNLVVFPNVSMPYTALCDATVDPLGLVDETGGGGAAEANNTLSKWFGGVPATSTRWLVVLAAGVTLGGLLLLGRKPGRLAVTRDPR